MPATPEDAGVPPAVKSDAVPAVVGDIDHDIQKLEQISTLGEGVLENFTQIIADIPKAEQIKAYAALVASMTTVREKIIDAKIKKNKGGAVQNADTINNNQIIVADARELNRILRSQEFPPAAPSEDSEPSESPDQVSGDDSTR